MIQRAANWLFTRLYWRVARCRPADFVVGEAERAYLRRWWLLGSRPSTRKPERLISRSILGIRPYLHCFLRSDDDRALHDHPGWSLSLCLHGSCIEHTIEAGGIHRRRRIAAGTVRFRSAKFAHRIEIEEGLECWTLFIFGPNVRHWGFHCPERGWVSWEHFTDPATNGATVGRGCEP